MTGTAKRALYVLGLSQIVVLAIAAGAIAGSKGRIIEGKKVGPVKLGMTKSQVKQRLGRPDDSGGDSWLYSDKRLRLGFAKSGRLTGVILFRRNFLTRKGIGYGSPLAAVQRAYPRAKCFLKEGTAPGAPACSLRSRLNGRRTETYFRFPTANPKARVWEITVHFGCYGCTGGK